MTIRAFHNLVKIGADAQGNPPKTIELLRTGTWNTPWHGDFEITPEDIAQFVVNADKGIGLVEADPKAPINYGHDAGDKAAGWMPKLYASDDSTRLLSDPDWTPAAVQAIKDGEWKYISPEFNPRSYPWENPEQEYDFVSNVLTGAALTNIPLFKKLKPISASRLDPKKVKAAATGNGDKRNEGENMTLEDIRAKQVADLNDDEKAFLAEHKTDLTADELKTFGLEETDDAAAQAAADKEAADKKAADEAAAAEADAEAARVAAIEASAKPVSITADRLAKLEADASAGREAQQKLAHAEATAIITASVTAGQIKSGEKDRAVKLLLASEGSHRTELEAFIKGLPVNASLGEELGDAGLADVEGATAELHAKVTEAIKASADKGKVLAYSQARKEVLAADATLKERVNKEEKS